MAKSSLYSVYLTIMVAFLCILLPWSGYGLKLRPDFVLLLLIFWMLRAPHLCNIGTAWFVGLWMDLATGGVFGQYALAYTITAFIAIMYQRRLALFNATQQLLYVLMLLVIAQLILLILKTFSGVEVDGWSFFLPSITGVMLWQLAVALGLKTSVHSRT
ncbi:MAG: rod shape-determining protein MreD [Betaproteobacteria bacterium]|nr:rod shape-determining protein MreD [Betaproteobacteria bacterium]